MKKARSSLNMLGAALEREEAEWIATIAYYARYYAVYSLFQRCGITSEIHDCTLAAFGYLFTDEGIVKKALYGEIIDSKESRIDSQYYIGGEVNIQNLKEDALAARNFVLTIEETLDSLSDKTIEKVRQKLKVLL
ncbi:MAG: hypothetical protein V1794_08980 [Candidatus Glassbacteria bacterium]